MRTILRRKLVRLGILPLLATLALVVVLTGTVFGNSVHLWIIT